ncbi:DNA adenine methyltransferase YhdJ [Clostridium homopropionicum DSM 5847]|uniref:Methyltransferase n=1 Tax=Clostridium homopropionicum DSM 5847 TaxID=1121318 RepID=A0A0L6ZDW6_9CLOT|nr:site-specific DNA-methyltransferase [Clostridium homopropionicum]KOA21160.1 DNA adenine methyltransferase YhdJ [Clostridium homopropionicum DSM 5847]SFG25642.1 DNA modification methylase [Clostridium homopropionicum]
MDIQKIAVEKLNPAKYNPRKDLKKGDPEYEKLKRSIETFGYVQPVIWNKKTGHIVGGHQRFKILKEQGVAEVECVVVEMDEAEEKALNIALNKVSGDWDMPKLAELLEDLDKSMFDVSLTGFDAAEIDDLFSKVHDKDVKEDDFDTDKVLEEIKNPISKAGDIWLLGKHRLICGDSTKLSDVERLMEGKKANLCVTDPPYNVNYSAGKENERVIKNDNMEDSKFYDFLLAAYKNAFEVLDDGAGAYIFHADTEGLNFRKAFKDAGFHLANVCIWVKQSLVLGRSDYQWQHEPVLYGWKPTGKHRWYSDRKQTTVWNFDRPKKSPDHPTMKPVPLMAYPIQNSSMTNCIIYEPFAGSGSTLIACEQTGRICYAVELDEKYCDVIVKRFIEAVGEDGVFLIRDGEKIKYADIKKEGCD